MNSALKFDEIDVKGVDALEDAVERAGLALELELDGRAVGSGVDGGLACDHDEARVVRIGVLNAAGEDRQAVHVGARER